MVEKSMIADLAHVAASAKAGSFQGAAVIGCADLANFTAEISTHSRIVTTGATSVLPEVRTGQHIC